MKLFKSYTGSAFLNQAIQTLEVLMQKKHPSDLDTKDILNAFLKPYGSAPLSLTNINQRLKSYTMVFTKNGPLHNDKEKGKEVYERLMKEILEHPENDGDKICELSGLKYSTTFEAYYQNALRAAHYPADKIAKKDLSINRCWFPLIGGLGSDAQALPQASFAINIHPVCLAILQFLPLSALLYKGGVLLIDSPDFSFSKCMVEIFLNRVKEEVTSKPSNKAIENIRDYSKGDYLIHGLATLSRQEVGYGSYVGFNFWSFSNSGTGANCLIDRVPNGLIRKLRQLYEEPACTNQLKIFLQDTKKSEGFLSSLEGNRDFWGLYPAKNYAGVEIPFFEYYQELIGNTGRIKYARYIAYLLHQQNLAKDESKLLARTDAYTSESKKRYTTILYKLLRDAAERKVWHPLQQLDILNDVEKLPIDSDVSNLYQTVHYYYQKLSSDDIVEMPSIPNEPITNAYQGLKLILHLLANDAGGRTAEQLTSRGYQAVSLNELLWRVGSEFHTLESIYPYIYDNLNREQKFGIRRLLHIFLSYYGNDLSSFYKRSEAISPPLSASQLAYLGRLSAFSETYFIYYQTFRNNQHKDLSAFRRHVLKPMVAPRFQVAHWMEEVLESMKKAYSEDITQSIVLADKQVFSEALFYDFTGNYNPHFARFAIAYHLHHLYFLNHKIQQNQHG